MDVNVCTLIILRRPNHNWPLLLAANRDEMRDRPWAPPGRHWEDRAEVVAGLDQQAGGSWLGINDYGVVAAVMNREGTLGPAAGKRSRGELVLAALDHALAQKAAEALADLDPQAYRAFNLFIGDPVSGFWLRNQGGQVETFKIPPGLHMLTAREIDDSTVPRIRTYLPRFRKARVPDPAINNSWSMWQSLLASRLYLDEDGPHGAMNLDFPNGLGTVCSHLLAVPRYPGFESKPVFLFAGGPPDRAEFIPIAI